MRALVIALVLIYATPSFAQRYTVYAYSTPGGSILAYASADTLSQNATGRTTTSTTAVSWLPLAAPDDLIDSDDIYHYRFASGRLARLSKIEIDTATAARRLRRAIEYRIVLQSRILALEREMSEDQSHANEIQQLIDKAHAEITSSRNQ